MKVAILGCGPAGLLAAHAATITGHQVRVFSRKRRSPMAGAQYMHVEIPDLRLPEPSIIDYRLLGTIQGYRDKVYGSKDPDVVVSPEQFLGSHKCWDLRLTYARLWHRWEPKVVNMLIDQVVLYQLSQSFDVIISTIPAQVLCENPEEHQFKYVPVWIDNMWSGPLPAELPGVLENMVICNGLPIDGSVDRTGWYRTSHIYGHMNTEWTHESLVPDNRSKPPGHVWKVRKPISTNCTCWPKIIRAGRYGLWEKGVLTHHAYEQAMMVLS